MNKFGPLLPLLVPSFSSKGNLFLPQGGKYISDNYSLIQAMDVCVSKSYLVSAYDIYYGFMPQDPNDLPDTEYLFIDSGGYEISDGFDLSERNKFNYQVLPWDKERMEETYDRVVACPKFKNSSVVLSTYDITSSIDVQLAGALSIKKDFPNAVIDFIVKGDNPVGQVLHGLSDPKRSLEPFSIIGFTEKELGSTIRNKLLNLLCIKRWLADCGWQGCIHIFGGLEPNLTKLYFMAGADIFDGLSWQRMYFRDGASIYNPKTYRIALQEHENKFLMMKDNLWIIQDLSNYLSTQFASRLAKVELFETLLKNDNITIDDILTALEVCL